jgi:hypothetical protein
VKEVPLCPLKELLAWNCKANAAPKSILKPLNATESFLTSKILIPVLSLGIKFCICPNRSCAYAAVRLSKTAAKK